MDEIVIKYAADMSKLQNELRKTEESQLHLAKGAVATSAVITKESDKAAKGVQKVEKSTHGLKDAFTQLSGNLPFAGAIQQVTQLGGSMGGAVAGVQQLSTAWTALDLIFKRSVIGLIITAVVALITAVTTFFRVSEQGGDKLAKIMSVIGVITDKVTGLFISLGRAVVGVFEFGFEKATEFYDFMVDTFLSGLTQTAKALRSLGFEESAKKIEEATDSIKKFRKESEDAAKRLISLGAAIADLDDKIEGAGIDADLALKDLNNSINANIKSLRDRSHTYEETLAILDEIEKSEKEKLKISTDLINEEIRLEGLKFKARSENQLLASINFTAFVNGQMKASELLNKVDGKNTAEEVKRIAELLGKRKDAIGEEMAMQERLNALRANFAIRDQKGHNETTLAKVEDIKLLAKTDVESIEHTKKEEEKRDKAKKASFANFKKMSDDLIAENKKAEEAQTKKLLEEEAKRKEIRQQSIATAINLTSQLLNGINELELQKDLRDLDKEKSANEQKEAEQIASLERRNELGLISDRQLATQKEKILKESAKKDLLIQRKKFEAEKKAKLIGIAIETISGIAKAAATYLSNPLTAPLFPGAAFAIAAEGALAAAFVAAQKPPGFKDGVIDLKGPGTGTSDSITARLSKGESVFTAEETKQHKPLFTAIREGKYDDFMKRNAIVEEAKRKQSANRQSENEKKATAENILKALALNGLVDTSHLERLTKKNKSVKLENVNEILDGMERIMKPKSGRGL